MSVRRLLLLLSGLFALALLVFGLASSAQGRPSAGADASMVYRNGHAGPAGGSTTPSPTSCANTWNVLASYPTVAAYQAAAFFNGQVYIFGGYNASASVLSASYRYDPANNTWYALAPLPQGRSGARAVSDGTYIYILGGDGPNLILTNTLWRYDPAANSYQTLAPFSVATSFHAAVYLAGRIYRIAGNGTASMEVYDIASNSWSNASSYPLSIAGVMAVTDGTYIYTAGGTNQSVKTYRYDPSSNSWDDASIPDLPGPHEAGAAGFIDGHMIVAGGFIPNNAVTNEVLSWTPGQSSWVTRAPLPNADGGMGSAADGTNLYAVGGVANTQFRDWNQRYYEFGCGTPTATLTGTPPTATPTHTSTPTVTGTPPTATATATATATPTPDCSSVDVHPTTIWPPGAFIYVTVPPGWTWDWDATTSNLMYYNCHPQYPYGVDCHWSCSIEWRLGHAIIHIYDQIGVERCSVHITGNQPECSPTAIPTAIPTGTSTPTPTQCPGGLCTPTRTATPMPTNTRLPTQTPGGLTATPEPSDTITSTAAPTQIPIATSTACPVQFTDVTEGSTFYPFVRCLACRGIINGYANGTFRPNNNMTRGQLSKTVSNSAGLSDPQTTQMFQDVPMGSTFQVYIARLASRGYISGYACGGAGEPCMAPGNLPYFRPNNNANRGQISKIVSNAAGFTDPVTGQTFQDVPPRSTFYDFIERLASRGVMGGYPCGSPEPCVGPGNLPYFRPNNNATRGQTSKIVANTFYPDCQTPAR